MCFWYTFLGGGWGYCAPSPVYKKDDTRHEELIIIVAAVRGAMSCCECKVTQDTGQGSILYSILNRDALCPQARADPTAAHRCCSCASMRKLVAIRAPQSVIRAACEVLLKTFKFVKNVPCFRGLPADDQLRLVRNSWAPLLLLGLVQDSVDFDTVETQKPSLLHEILTHDADRRERTAGAAQHPGVPLCDVQSIQMFLVKCRGLTITVKEHAFLKGAILFTPGKITPALRHE